jgi:hypothetical protein
MSQRQLEAQLDHGEPPIGEPNDDIGIAVVAGVKVDELGITGLEACALQDRAAALAIMADECLELLFASLESLIENAACSHRASRVLVTFVASTRCRGGVGIAPDCQGGSKMIKQNSLGIVIVYRP